MTSNISIHAPQWGATGLAAALAVPVKISIHAPQWGATVRPTVQRIASGHFNPRTPVGCDVDGYHYTRSNTDFNPRTPVGRDDACTSRPIGE